MKIEEELNKIESNIIDKFKQVEDYIQNYGNYFEYLPKIKSILTSIKDKADKTIIR